MIDIGLGFILGTVLGSLVLCLAARSTTKESYWGRSYCDHCKKQLTWYDLFPLFSFLFNKFKARCCNKKLSIEYPVVELVTGLLIGYLFWQTNAADTILAIFMRGNLLPLLDFADIIFKIFIICIFLIVFITDIKTGLIPDRITFPAVVIGLAGLVLLTLLKTLILYQGLASSTVGQFLLPPHSDYFYRHAFENTSPLWMGILAALGLGGFFLTLILLTKGRGMGGGDFKLSIFIGLVFGFPLSLVVMMLSFLLGAVTGVALLLIGKKHFGQTIPFGPFLSISALITLFWGNQLLNWYLSLSIS